MSAARPLVTTSGDLEVAILHENQSLLAELISDHYYGLVGQSGTEVRFHNRSSFRNFITHVHELVSPGDNVSVEGQGSLSLLSGIRWFCLAYPDEAASAGLDDAVSALEHWLGAERKVSFWFPDGQTEVYFRMTRHEMISYAANLAKHRLLRLRLLAQKLKKLAERSGVALVGTELVSMREPFEAELESRLVYLGSWLVELLGDYWLAVNEVVRQRFERNPTNWVQHMEMPADVTSEAIRNLYGDTLVFLRFDRDRIIRHVPRVTALSKLRY